ncbi:MAG: hypothetical protein ACXWUG_26620 [Polyangiales bacterium]
MTSHAYPPARWLVHAVLTDLLLVCMVVGLAVSRAPGPLSRALLLAIPAVLLWGVVTLNQPSAVELDDEAITFRAYGRAHRYAWSDVKKLSVRRFLVRDRVLVRIAPSPPWRGRYWILDGIEGFSQLVSELERRSHRKT